jgi:hypothetical protein
MAKPAQANPTDGGTSLAFRLLRFHSSIIPTFHYSVFLLSSIIPASVCVFLQPDLSDIDEFDLTRFSEGLDLLRKSRS